MAGEKVGNIYAAALLELAEQKKEAQPIEEELADVAKLLAADEGVWKFFRSPVIDPKEKMQILSKAVKGSVSELMFNFLGVIAARRRFDDLHEIALAYAHLLDSKSGRRRVRVRMGAEATKDQLEKLKKALKDFLKAEVVLEAETEVDLMGGMVVRSGDYLIDTSVRNHLQRIKRELLNKRILGRDYYEN
ncbi:MAG: ATP synthase F1 subunit delta [Spirochaetia bacterium]|nr:ATP synthase F1 subunit delta [Spirochaetia bacterium]